MEGDVVFIEPQEKFLRLEMFYKKKICSFVAQILRSYF